ncbi:MAG TPA: hypothetical protein VFA89_14255 [Terriglobales bacterium]|nr:hypothetical protein [Terriglobales bacterium]
MSANATVASAVIATHDRERGHRRRVLAAYLLFATLILGLAVHGFDYYTLSAADRPFSPKHVALRPSGAVGLKLGFLGLGMFLVIFLYPLRKRWAWLLRQGSAKHWLDFHVVLGIAAPFVIAFHASFKFRGFAGMAFWIMVSVSLSGIIGRYLYSQIPRSLSAAEISLKELQDARQQLATQLAKQHSLPGADLKALLRLPTAEQVKRWPAVYALIYMLGLDLLRPFQIAKLRRHALTFAESIRSFGGMVKTGNLELEAAIATARDEAALAKRILFLSRSQQVFHLWHVVHKPFSYSFALLAIIHIVVVMMMGYF